VKVNTSLLLNQNNISGNDPHYDDSQINLQDENLSIFQKEDVNNEEIERSIYKEKEVNEEGDEVEVKSQKEKEKKVNEEKKKKRLGKEKDFINDILVNEKNNTLKDTHGNTNLKLSGISTSNTEGMNKTSKATSCRCLIF